MNDQIQMMDSKMFNLVMEELRHIRKRLDAHIDDEKHTVQSVQRDVSKIREDMAGHRVKLTGITSLIAVIVSGFIAWIFNHLGR